MNLTVTALGWTLVHFLWQGAAIAALLAAARHLIRNASAQARYAAATAAMFLMLACSTATFLYLYSADAPASHPTVQNSAVASANVPASSAITKSPAPTWRDRVPDYFPPLVYLWMAGVLVLSVRSLGGWVLAHRWKRSKVRPAEAFWQDRMTRLAKRLAIARTVRLWESAVAETPAVIGWIRPVVLFPASALSGLAPGQIEALLAHELAHIRRHDYLINLLQTAVETLFFYHPAVWWIGREMRAERENCCDDLAVSVCGDALIYARALTELEHIRAAAPRLAMAANSGSLLDRVRRLLDPQHDSAGQTSGSPNRGDWFTAVAIASCVVSLWATSHSPIRWPANPAPQHIDLVSALYRERPVPLTRREEQRTIERIKVKLAALKQDSEEQEQQPPSRPTGNQNLVDGLAALGYKDLSVDDLISLKIHGVTSDYVSRLLAAGLKLKIDEIVSFAIHGAHPADIVEMQKLGYKLGSEEIVSMQIHGLTPDFARQMKSTGLGTPTFEQLISFSRSTA